MILQVGQTERFMQSCWVSVLFCVLAVRAQLEGASEGYESARSILLSYGTTTHQRPWRQPGRWLSAGQLPSLTVSLITLLPSDVLRTV